MINTIPEPKGQKARSNLVSINILAKKDQSAVMPPDLFLFLI